MMEGGGVAGAKRETQAQILDMLQTRQSDLCPNQSQWEERKKKRKKEGKESDNDSGEDSNLRSGKWPAML